MSRALITVVLAGATLLFAILDPRAAGAGWSAAFLFVGSAPIGAIALLLIARLTGADWSLALAPIAAPMPLVLLAVLPLIAVEAALWRPVPSHLALYLSPLPFALRSLVALGFWAWIGRLALDGRLTELGAALALVGYGLLVSFMALDWVLAVDPGRTASDMGMALATQHILAATACACLAGRGPDRLLRDLSGLMVAAALGLAYLLYMDWLVVWFGNLPGRVGWYIVRSTTLWSLFALAGLGLGLFGPIAALSFGRRRLAGALALTGLALTDAWLVVPRFGALALIGAALATSLLASAFWWAAPFLARRPAGQAAHV